MASSSSKLVNNLSEWVHKIKYKHQNDDENLNLLELHKKYATVYLNIKSLRIIGCNANVYVVTKIISKSLMNT